MKKNDAVKLKLVEAQRDSKEILGDARYKDLPYLVIWATPQTNSTSILTFKLITRDIDHPVNEL